ncbi:MAG TPA: hypothetical protein DCG75_18675 [Bacteroidales bacterium]|nr:hypothetical protein [Bacteroidales bacterium]
MNEELNELYNRIYQDESTKDSKKFIQIIEENISIIDKTDYTNQEDYVKATRLLSDYSLFLVNAGYLRKAIPYLDKAVSQIENSNAINESNIWSEPLYERLIWERGITNFHLRERNKAKKDFYQLIAHFPDNDKYKNWFKACSDKSYNIAEWTFAGIALISIFISFIVKPENGIIDRIAFYGIFFGLFGGLLTKFFRNRRLKM